MLKIAKRGYDAFQGLSAPYMVFRSLTGVLRRLKEVMRPLTEYSGALHGFYGALQGLSAP